MSCIYDRVDVEARHDWLAHRDLEADRIPDYGPSATDLARENAADPSCPGRGVDGAHQQEG